MDHGLYSAYLGMRARQRALDVMANNIANSSTTGFKADRMLYQSVAAAASEQGLPLAPPAGRPQLQLASLNQAIVDPSLASSHGRNIGLTASTIADYSSGQVKVTGSPLDIALDGKGFLAVQTPQGERYTRNGSLKLNADGQLVTQHGDLVAGQNGPITLPPGDITIGRSGDISVSGQTVDQLKIVQFDSPAGALMKDGDSLFVTAAGQQAAPATGTQVIQNALEMSNVDPIAEMAAMLKNSREFDSLQKSLSTLMNDIGRTVANDIGKV
ncbi:MAG TPA: flagellar basal-body rod protein FlgF [Blastocatellia bacterium]|nr:flagellar basal-body rod protein FlgF [Blastocatellia bacterium]